MSLQKKVNDFYQNNKGLLWIAFFVLALLYVLPSLTTNISGVSYDSGISMGMAESKIAIAPSYYGGESDISQTDRTIRKSAWLSLESSTYEQTKLNLRTIVEQNKGLILSENEYTNEYQNYKQKSYSISLKVPQENFQQTIDQLKEIAELQNLNINADDVTTYYTDLKSYLANEIALKAKLQALLAETKDVSDIIAIQQQLNQVQSNIDNYQRQITDLDRQTDLSSISVTLTEKRGVASTIFEFTGLTQLVKNIVLSFNIIVTTISLYFAHILVIIAGIVLYKKYNKKKR